MKNQKSTPEELEKFKSFNGKYDWTQTDLDERLAQEAINNPNGEHIEIKQETHEYHNRYYVKPDLFTTIMDIKHMLERKLSSTGQCTYPVEFNGTVYDFQTPLTKEEERQQNEDRRLLIKSLIRDHVEKLMECVLSHEYIDENDYYRGPSGNDIVDLLISLPDFDPDAFTSKIVKE